jgi:hypothetical protein
MKSPQQKRAEAAMRIIEAKTGEMQKIVALEKQRDQIPQESHIIESAVSEIRYYGTIVEKAREEARRLVGKDLPVAMARDQEAFLAKDWCAKYPHFRRFSP